MSFDLHSFSLDAVLRDGGSIHLRPLLPKDKSLLAEHFTSLSPLSVYFRFFRSKKRLTDEELKQFTELDFRSNVALVATLIHGSREKIIGVGRYSAIERDDKAPIRAEVAFAVTDAHQGRGIGTLLLEHLARIASENGITEFEADVLGENNRMLRMFAGSGFKVKRSMESGVFHVSFPTQETEAVAQAQHRRERQAAAQSIRAFLHPRAVAIVGASRSKQSIGAALVKNIKGCGFTGPIYPVNPKASRIQGLQAYPSVSAVGQPVDLAVIAVPAPAVEEAIEDCAGAGVKGVVVISAGFGEVSEEGRKIEARLRARVRGSGMRMVGPNCMGVLNTDPAVSLNATFAPAWPPAGNIAMLSQSGALGLAILDRVQALNLGLSTFVSVGNKADVSGNDLLAYWGEDPGTQVILLYLESFGNPLKFARVTPEVARRKPIIAVKSGRSAAGIRAASSHSAALADRDVAVDSLFEQAGVIRTNTLEELLDVAALLSTQPAPAGPRVGVITNAGGPGILLADACEAKGLQLPELSAQTMEELRSFLPGQASVSNPVDMIASAGPEDYERAIEIVGRDINVDSLVVIYIPPLQIPPEKIAAAIAEGAGKVDASKPILTVYMSSQGTPEVLGSGARGHIPSYSFPENASLALSAAERYARWRKRMRGSILTLDSFSRSAIRAVVDRVLEEHPEPVWLGNSDLSTILRAAGIDFAESEQVSVSGAVEAAERLGYPLVAKAIAPGVLHKSDVGGVILGIDSREAAAEALEQLLERMDGIGSKLEAVLLQREIAGGIEAFVGVTRETTFGPLVVCGLGGVMVELLHDVSFRLPPVSDLDAREMLSRLRAGRLLDGYRGTPPGDRQALIGVIQRVSALVDVIPELREMDLNPVKVLKPGGGAVVVDARMRIGPVTEESD